MKGIIYIICHHLSLSNADFLVTDVVSWLVTANSCFILFLKTAGDLRPQTGWNEWWSVFNKSKDSSLTSHFPGYSAATLGGDCSEYASPCRFLSLQLTRSTELYSLNNSVLLCVQRWPVAGKPCICLLNQNWLQKHGSKFLTGSKMPGLLNQKVQNRPAETQNAELWTSEKNAKPAQQQ